MSKAIDLENDIQPVSDFRANAATMIKRVRRSRRPLVLTQKGRGAAVLLDLNSYQSLIDELDLLRDIHRGLDDEASGRVVPHEKARRRLLQRYR
jgi:prevent-host-death family protein